jgi:hypothetical protein
MALERVATVVRTVARDGAAARALRADPEQLARRLGLGPQGASALRSADRFFRSEKPILERAAPLQPFVAPPAQRATVRLLAASIVASADTGTLLPGPNTGSLTDSGRSATAGQPGTPPPAVPAAPPPAPAPALPPAPAAPAMPAPAPGMPAPIGPAPFQPAQPQAPFPALPGFPAPAPGPAFPPFGPSPQTLPCPSPPPFPQPGPVQPPAMPGLAMPPGCGCCAATVLALVGVVSTTAQTAQTAIVGIAAQACRRAGR